MNSRASKNLAKAAEIEAWLELLAGASNVLQLDAATFRAWAKPMHHKSDALYEDAMIAAMAQVLGLTVTTRKVADSDALGFEAFNPFLAASAQAGSGWAHFLCLRSRQSGSKQVVSRGHGRGINDHAERVYASIFTAASA